MKKTIEKPDFKSPLTLDYWKAAASEIYNVRSLVVCAVLIAMRVALKTVFIPLGSVKIYVGFPINAVSGAICGPVLSLISGLVCDLVGFAIAPSGEFNIIFPFIEMLCAFMYSLSLYRVKITGVRLFTAKASVNLIGNVILSIIARIIVEGIGVLAYLPGSIAKNVLMLPVEVLILMVVFNALTPLLIKMKFIPAPQEKMRFDFGTILFFATATVVVAALTYFFYDELYAFIKAFLSAK